MKRLIALYPVLLACTASVHVGCERKRADEARPVAQENAVPRTDIDGLARLVNLPYAPSAVKWATEKYPMGGNWALTVLLSLSKDDVAKLLANAEVFPNCRPKVTREVFQEWFPPSARTELNAEPAANGETVTVDAVCIRPTSFTVPEKSPAIHGDALVFEKHGLVLLDLYTM